MSVFYSKLSGVLKKGLRPNFNPPSVVPVRINCGGPEIQFNQDAFSGDRLFSGGGQYFAEGGQSPLYQTDRNGSPSRGGTPVYTLPLGVIGPRRVLVRLHFCELYFQAADQRKFDVLVNGKTYVAGMDIYTAAGGRFLPHFVDVVVDTTDTATVTFNVLKDVASISAIELLNGAGMTLTPEATPSDPPVDPIPTNPVTPPTGNWTTYSGTPTPGTSGQVKPLWFANTGRGGSVFDSGMEMVGSAAQGAYIAADGKTVTSQNWDENGAEGHYYPGTAGGLGFNFQDVHPDMGPACTIDPVAGKAWLSNRNHNGFIGIRRFPLTRSGSEAQVGTGAVPFGIAVIGSSVYVACADSVMRKYDKNSLAGQGSWSIPKPLHNSLIAVDGKLALLNGNSVNFYSTSGGLLGQINGLVDPKGLGIDNRTATERLVVCLGRTDHRLAVYDATTYAFVDTFGQQGGVYASNSNGGRGNMIDRSRLIYPRAARIFPDGSWQVVCSALDVRSTEVDAIQGGCIIRRLSSKTATTSTWELNGLAFCDLGAIDTETWVDAYTPNFHHKFDQATGAWTPYAMTLDLDNYPNVYPSAPYDIRDQQNHDNTTPWVFTYEGKKFLVVESMYGVVTNKTLQMYRKVEDTFVPAGSTFGPANARGVQVTSTGVFWIADGGGVRRRAVTGLDASGTPILGAETYTAKPADFSGAGSEGNLKRFFHDEATDAAYVTGWSASFGSPGTHDMEKMAGNSLARFNNFSTAGFSQKAWQIGLPSQDVGGGIRGLRYVIAVAIAGDYIFTRECSHMNARVYRKSDGALVKEWITGSVPAVPFTSASQYTGQFSTNAYRNGYAYPEQPGVGVLDVVHGMHAYKHPNGVYLITLYDNGAQKVILEQWTP